ncbi:DUF1302 domain-containing protein [Pseudoduganella sp. UC29_71]|uniref:DUF1302 domain-containing protein n=1 Tax=Pseudoduganella sp. UC29_71 TaxID=3350174 RepID=UPI00366BFBAF
MQAHLKKNTILPGLLAVALAAYAAGAGATEFDLEDGWTGSWNNTIFAGQQWRATAPDADRYTAGNGKLIGLNGGTAGHPNDAGNLNYDKGDRISTMFKLLTELELKNGDMGALVRAKLWYDHAGKNHNARFGNMANGYTPNTTLSDAGLERLQKFDGAYLLDAYVYNTFKVADKPLQLRLGRQVINWGESLFVQGVNGLNPVDLGTLRRPGAELKEALLPLGALSASVGLGGGHSVEAFYQYQSGNTSIDSCGTYWSVTETSISATAGACKAATLVPLGGVSGVAAFKAGMYVPIVDGKRASDGGQYGLAYRFPVDAIDTEFGLYATNVHMRTPIVSGTTGTNLKAINPAIPLLMPLAGFAGVPALNPATNPAIKPMTAFWEYLEDVRTFAVSASTNLGGWSIGSELSYSPNVPVQRNGNDLIGAALQGAGPLGAIARAAVAKGPGTYVQGYDRFHKTQFQLNGVNTFSNVLGAQQAVVVGELAIQTNNVPDFKDPASIRYGRAFMFGTSSHPLYGGSTCGATNPSPAGCQNDGFVTDFAWGYRLRGQLEYSNVAGTGITAYPSLYFAHDVKGISLDSQLLEERRQLGASVRLSYQKRHSLELSYTRFNHKATYDPLRDHDYIGLTYSATF